MGKKWNKYYLLLGSILMVILSALCSLVFVRSNIYQSQDKKTFESIYTDTSIDFIVPSPSDSQVEELEQDVENGIGAITPYYETSSTIVIDGNGVKGTTIIIPDAAKIQYTPYGSSRIVSGDTDMASGDAIADKTFVANNNCKIGDIVDLSISGHDFSFQIKGTAESNTYYKDGTIAVVLSEEQTDQLKSDGLKYSSAFISASDYEKCKSYLYSEYKPYGRLKDESEFDDVETYNQHVQNFEDADWTKEITNCKDNYASLSVKYENVDSGIYKNMIIAAIIIFLAVIIFNSVLLRLDDLKKAFQGFLVKKSGTKVEIKAFYRKGIILNAVVFCAVTIALYLWIASSLGIKLISNSVFTTLVIIVSQILASVIMIALSASYVEKNYSVQKQEQSMTLVGKPEVNSGNEASDQEFKHSEEVAEPSVQTVDHPKESPELSEQPDDHPLGTPEELDILRQKQEGNKEG